ncbi:CPBP family intramembrane glutamic endopeptidase [Pseudomarimonas salicorniae]|uniref:CPBP family intramembrane metalloprotease n=1 Tax=Pseudomarimonas salicorniae TaxID=2933270 RepID=A0ABT0GMU1_9GAMM|nr:type II CAAX endopeptidase family protein [Lysobacter sp. CAU 1642]MCK7595317.1 CPBP family intramembrane metalloprotease [Lysobacter sp. CAU 1642]
MIGPVLIAVSWLLLRLQGRPLSELGFNKPVQRLVEFVSGLALAGLFASLQFVLIAHFARFRWMPNPDAGLALVMESLRWNINSVLYEELVFRGYLLYKAIEWLGVRRACFLSAAAFGVYHWFSYGVIGSLVPMVYVFLLTGSFGLMLAYSFAMSRSVVLPIALHLGWNLATILVFSNGPLGAQLLVPSSVESMPLSVGEQLLTSLVIPIGFVVLVLWGVTRGIGRYGDSKVHSDP